MGNMSCCYNARIIVIVICDFEQFLSSLGSVSPSAKVEKTQPVSQAARKSEQDTNVNLMGPGLERMAYLPKVKQWWFSHSSLMGRGITWVLVKISGSHPVGERAILKACNSHFNKPFLSRWFRDYILPDPLSACCERGVCVCPYFALLTMAAVPSPDCLLLQPVAGLKFKKSFHW